MVTRASEWRHSLRRHSSGFARASVTPKAEGAGVALRDHQKMTRASFAAYDGKLFQVRRASDSKTQDITPTSAGGYVDADALIKFCSGTTCGVSILYDQTGNANDLSQATVIYQPVIQYWSRANGMQLPVAVTVDRQYRGIETRPARYPSLRSARPSTS
jgi:hypothetical protein